MKEDRLYYADPFRTEFSARVAGCEPDGSAWAVTLDATAFYPEGGGQPADTGVLGGARVLDVRERAGRVVHITDRPLPAGGTVEGVIDWPRRLDHMEQHTGEHILSGTLHRLYGAENVGFHIGPDTVRMDMSLPLTDAQLAEAERQANEAVRRDLPVIASWPDPDKLAATEYRSKKALEGPVRLITVPETDCCACCGTHLTRSGQVGLIAIVSAQPYKGGVRLAVVCGGRAAAWARRLAQQAHAVSALLSAPAEGLYQAVERQAVQAAAEKAESVSSALLAWGYGPDSNDPERRAADLELAARVGKSPTLMEVARHLGRLKELMDGKRKNGYAYGRGEKYSLELGGDINRAIASEFAMLAAPETLPLFLRKLQQKALKQYQRREPICKGSGDIICMLDESVSAESQAPWCKAVALALLDIAMRDQRRFAVIHFAGVGDVQTDRFLPGQYGREDVLRCAETFLNGNTDYETPLREALRLMEQEGFEYADMVFVTDGECALPDSFLEQLKAEQSVKGFQITGILLDQEGDEFEFSLRKFCTNVYRTSQLSRDQIAEQLVVSRIA